MAPSPKSSRSERITAIFSSVVAVAIIGTFVVADRTAEWPTVNLTALEADVRTQFDLAFRQDLPTYEARIESLDATVQAFRTSPQSARDREKLTEWLDGALTASMPGRMAALPPIPKFGEEPAAIIVAEAPPSAAEPQAPLVTVDHRRSATAPAEAAGAADRLIPVPAAEDIEDGELSMNDEPEFPADAAPSDDVDVIADEPPTSLPLGPTPTLADPQGLVPDVAPVMARDAVAPPAANSSLPHGETVTPGLVKVAPSVSLNLKELQARIAGYHAGLREVSGAAMRAGDRLSPAAGAMLVDELEDLCRQREFIGLYYDALSAQERRHISPPRAWNDAAATVATALKVAAESQDAAFDPFASQGDSPYAALLTRIHAIGGDAGRDQKSPRAE